jgi:hypothetical protein
MSEARTFRFPLVQTCFVVGAGSSAHLAYPSFCDAKSVAKILDRSVDRVDDNGQIANHRQNCRQLAHCLAERYNSDLERVYEHLAHVPPGFYPPYCYTHFMSQCIVLEIASRFGRAPCQEDLADATEAWRQLLAQHRRPAAIFTTNYDLVLEAVLASLGQDYADGWADGQYRREHFEDGTSAEVALLKLHGSADWLRAAQYTTLEVRKEAPPKTVRPACLAPLRRKWHTEEPYASGYDYLEKSLGAADALVVLGSSWRDVSVATALRRALWTRDKRLLHIHVYDRQPYAIEERVRLFLHESGAGQLSELLRWHHHQGSFPKMPVGDEGVERRVLGDRLTLADTGSWVRIPGEPPMVREPENGAFEIHWLNNVYYFESGRMVLVPRLPDCFKIDVRMTIRRYGSGWDSGLALDDEAGNEVVCARFIKRGHVWQHEGVEPDVSGVRIARGLTLYDRVQVDEGGSVEVRVSGSPAETVLTLTPQGGQAKTWCLGHAAEGRPTRLSLGGYPWYSDDGLGGSDRETNCLIGPCAVEPC